MQILGIKNIYMYVHIYDKLEIFLVTLENGRQKQYFAYISVCIVSNFPKQDVSCYNGRRNRTLGGDRWIPT